jgi:DNA-binding MarR family transcriptional regulator
MNSTLQAEIKQGRPFSSPQEEAYLNLVRTAALLQHAASEALKPYGVTHTQYNVLRILRGAGKTGLCRHEIRDRMLTAVPDVTRILDRLSKAELVSRHRDAVDRRLVTARITKKGLELLASLDGPTLELHQRLLGHMSDERLERLSGLLSEARAGA